MEIRRIVLAADDVPAMVAFHNAVFACELRPLDGADGFHLGTFCGIELLICPNSIAEVDARQNRHQFRVAVDDLVAAVAAVDRHDGRRLDDADPTTADVVGVADPEGNTYELTAS